MEEALYPISWAFPAVFDARRYSVVEIQGSSISGTWNIERSFDGVTFETAAAFSNNASDQGAVKTTMTADGYIVLDGGCWIKLSGGAGGSFWVRGED